MSGARPDSTVTVIAAVARNGVIGADGGLPWSLPGDLPRVKALTLGHVLVMGRKTFDSIGRPLPGRTTVVVTRQPGWSADGVEVARSVPEALELASSIDRHVFVFGGAEIYAQTLDVADRLELTEVHAEPVGDTRFPPVDWARWRETSREQRDGFDWATYVRS
ncbi:dihydrofolate reductase [Phytoactinopolyspora alkaliphila]|uniref:Dihydrofolate reductase n=1 Tax=Phytoactinopolyspora alkaliphila TaxID=1783498 RepID=A0A6N9YFN3_9ACTN|nr:dihydrofolate reductase [Phytoactinopolyspora alkaliphila]NED93715.1 dihydrofolate reductase [Phytoactinopolyspora alkaliphila]